MLILSPRASPAALCVLLAACGGSGSRADAGEPSDAGPRPDTGTTITASCSNESLSLEGTPIVFCIEYPGLGPFELIGVRAGCEASDHDPDAGPPYLPNTTFAEAPCARIDTIGGCTTTTSGTVTTTWWYAPTSPDTYRAACERDGGTWTTP